MTIPLNIKELLAIKTAFKTEKIRKRFSMMNLKAQYIALDAYQYALGIGVNQPVFTETATTEQEDVALNRKSRTHSECRAFDLRVIDWSGEQIDALIKYLTDKYGFIGAIQKDGTRLIVLYHDSGHGLHFHVQLDKTFAMPPIV